MTLGKVIFSMEMSLQMKHWAWKMWLFLFMEMCFQTWKDLRFCTFPETSWNFTLFQNVLSRTTTTYPSLQFLKKLLSDSFPIRVYVLKIILLVNKFVEIQMQLERGFDPIAPRFGQNRYAGTRAVSWIIYWTPISADFLTLSLQGYLKKAKNRHLF